MTAHPDPSVGAVKRLARRALVAGIGTFLLQMQLSASWDSALLKSAGASAVWAAAEVLFPQLNNTVGLKKPAYRILNGKETP